VVQLTVGASANLVNDGRLEVNEDSTRDVLASTGLGEEGVESVVTAADGLVRRHLTIWLDAVLEAVKLPAGVSGLDTTLADVKRDDLTHCCKGKKERRRAKGVGLLFDLGDGEGLRGKSKSVAEKKRRERKIGKSKKKKRKRAKTPWTLCNDGAQAVSYLVVTGLVNETLDHQLDVSITLL